MQSSSAGPTGPFKKFAVFVQSPRGDVLQDLDWPETKPLGGSETAGLKIIATLRQLGYAADLITNPAAVRNNICDVFISLRQWGMFGDGIRPGRLNYLWCQDDADQPLVSPLQDQRTAAKVYGNCTGIIFLSLYQKNRWTSMLNTPLDKIVMATNGVSRNRFNVDPEQLTSRQQWAYYSSTPFRGLEPLLAGWPAIRQAVPDAELHVFSSMKVYAADDETPYKELYEQARTLPGVHYHGSVGQAQLREAAQQCRVLAYPNTFPETSCIAAMEAMTAGCVVAGTTNGALPETAWKNPMVPPTDGWFDQWLRDVIRLLTDDEYYASLARQNLEVSKVYDWEFVVRRVLQQFEHDNR